MHTNPAFSFCTRSKAKIKMKIISEWHVFTIRVLFFSLSVFHLIVTSSFFIVLLFFCLLCQFLFPSPFYCLLAHFLFPPPSRPKKNKIILLMSHTYATEIDNNKQNFCCCYFLFRFFSLFSFQKKKKARRT